MHLASFDFLSLSASETGLGAVFLPDLATTALHSSLRLVAQACRRALTKSALLFFFARRRPPRSGARRIAFGNIKKADQLCSVPSKVDFSRLSQTVVKCAASVF